MAVLKNIHSPAGPRTSQHVPACTRCAGLLIRERLLDLFDETGQMRRWAWRCVQCGDIVDSLILKHRMGVDLPAFNVMRRRRWTTVQALTRKLAHS